jgi:hypothetical protein
VQSNGAANSSWATVEVGRLIKETNKRLVDVHARRLVEVGADESGLYDHYAKLIEAGSVLCEPDLEAFRVVRESLPVFGEYAVLRAGLGELALLLNGAGLRVVACEMNAKRFEALTAGCDNVDDHAEEDVRLRLVEAFLPDRVRGRPVLGIATDFAYNLDLERDDAFRRGMGKLDALLVNPRLFIRVRNSALEQRAGISFLRVLGFTDITECRGSELVFAARPPRRVADDASSVSDAAYDGDFDALVEAVMALVPPTVRQSPTTTWVERRVRAFDMKSAFGNGE